MPSNDRVAAHTHEWIDISRDTEGTEFLCKWCGETTTQKAGPNPSAAKPREFCPRCGEYLDVDCCGCCGECGWIPPYYDDGTPSPEGQRMAALQSIDPDGNLRREKRSPSRARPYPTWETYGD